MGKKRKLKDTSDEYEFDPVPRHMVNAHLKDQEKRLIVILEGAQLETVKVVYYNFCFCFVRKLTFVLGWQQI